MRNRVILGRKSGHTVRLLSHPTDAEIIVARFLGVFEFEAKASPHTNPAANKAAISGRRGPTTRRVALDCDARPNRIAAASPMTSHY